MRILTLGGLRRLSAPGTPSKWLRLLALGGVFLVGCGGDSGTDPDPDPDSDPAEQTTTSRLIVQIQPGSMGTGAPFPVQPVIEIQDTTGNLLTNDNSTVVTATIASGNGTLQGQASATASRGIVSYVDLAISDDPADYRLAFTAEGFVPDTSIAFPLEPGGERVTSVGTEGVSIVLGDGASLVIPTGGVDGQVSFEFRDSLGLTPRFHPLADQAYQIAMTLVDPNTTFNPTDSLLLALPIDSDAREGGTPMLRAVFAAMPDESFWAVPEDPLTSSIAIPVSALLELGSIFGGGVLLSWEEIPTEGTVPSTPGTLRETDGAVDAFYEVVGYDDYPLRHDELSAPARPGGVAIILIHGWLKDVDDCPQYEWLQNLQNDPNARADFGIPGERYFETLIPVIRNRIGTQYPLYVFSYPTIEHFEDSGNVLGDSIRSLLNQTGLDGVMLVGHSMGGLVARQAAAGLASESVVRGIVTLGTPHQGTQAVDFGWDFFKYAAQERPGGRSLRFGSTSETEEAPIFAYGGDIFSGRDPATIRRSYKTLGEWLCSEHEMCQNDGVVPLQSAVPSFISQSRQRPDFNYDHTELHEGAGNDGDAEDEIYQQLFADIQTLAPPSPPAWLDDFEAYSVGSFPSPWTPDANAASASSSNHVDNSVSYDGDKSLKLHGSLGGCWAALSYRPLTVTPPYEVQLAVRNGTETLSGCHPSRGGIGIRQGTSWRNPSRSFLSVGANGSLGSTSGSLDLGTMDLSAWHLVRIRYERPSPSEAMVSYWIDGNYKGFEIVVSTADEDQLTNLEFNAQEGTVWYDAVVVVQR